MLLMKDGYDETARKEERKRNSPSFYVLSPSLSLTHTHKYI